MSLIVKNKQQPITPELVLLTKEWLGEDGHSFFYELKEKHGEIAVVYDDGGFPHAVHFMEGMQVRNFMRGTGLCDEWDAHMYDDSWVSLIDACIKEN